MLISRTPYRISLAGGGTDFPEWFKRFPSAVVSGTINKYSYITCRPLNKFFDHNYRIVYSLVENVLDIEDIKHPAVREVIKFLEYKNGLEIHHDGDLPARTGLGSSSAFTVGLLQLVLKIQNKEISKKQLAKLAIKLEREFHNENGGMQDQIACTYGGVNKFTFKYVQDLPEFDVSPISISKERLELFQSQIKLIYTGKQRFSSQVSEKLTEIFEESWVNKKQLNSDSITRELQEIKDFGMQNGASGTKVLGAGGGGFLAFWVTENNREKFLNAFKDYVIVDIIFESEGSKIVYEQS